MRQKIFILLGFAVLIVILIGLNALSYHQKEQIPDSELNPNRSTYNAGVTGTRAFFELLTTGGNRVVRWQRPSAELNSAGKDTPSTLVIVGETRREITDEEADQILDWVNDGGRLVIIDRSPPLAFAKSTTNWTFLVSGSDLMRFTADPADQNSMTKDVKAMRPVQPTSFTKGVNAVQPSVLAAGIVVSYAGEPATQKGTGRAGDVDRKPPPKVVVTPKPEPTFTAATPKPAPTLRMSTPTPTPVSKKTPGQEYDMGDDEADAPVVLKAPPVAGGGSGGSGPPVVKSATPPAGIIQNAPVVHIADEKRNLLIDVPYGAGRVVVLSDPFVVSNGGIALVDNARLATNIVGVKDGIIAFDEYHQGFGDSDNRLLEYFNGTPVLPLAIQFALFIGLVFYSQSRRFARAVPEPEPNRLSKLEYVAAMAELQQRTKGYDLAIENIFGDFRRRVARLVGVDAQKVRPRDLALLINERLPDENPRDLEAMIGRAIDIQQGDPTNKKEVLQLTKRIREIEEKLGLQRAKRGRRIF